MSRKKEFLKKSCFTFKKGTFSLYSGKYMNIMEEVFRRLFLNYLTKITVSDTIVFFSFLKDSNPNSWESLSLGVFLIANFTASAELYRSFSEF